MKRTGVFYHEICGRKPYKIFVFDTGVEKRFESLEREGLFQEPNVFLFESEPVTEELILKVHTEDMVERVKASGYYKTSLYSAGGNVGAFFMRMMTCSTFAFAVATLMPTLGALALGKRAKPRFACPTVLLMRKKLKASETRFQEELKSLSQNCSIGCVA